MNDEVSFGKDDDLGPPLMRECLADIVGFCMTMSGEAMKMGVLTPHEAVETACRSTALNVIRMVTSLLEGKHTEQVEDLIAWKHRTPPCEVTIEEGDITFTDEALDEMGEKDDDTLYWDDLNIN